MNALDKVPLSVHGKMKKPLGQLAPGRASAEAAVDAFAEKYHAKYCRAVECLTKDGEARLPF